MARLNSVKWITPDNVIEKIKRYQTYKVYANALNFNWDNKDAVEKLIAYIFKDTDKIWTSELENILRQYVIQLGIEAFGDENKRMTHKHLYLNFWMIRGWDKVQSIEILKTLHEGTIFTSTDDILNYFKNVNSHDINLNNIEYLNKIVNLVEIKFGNIWWCDFYVLLRKFWKEYYKDTENLSNSRGYITGDIRYWLARGWTEKDAKDIINKKFKSSSILSLDYYKKHGINEAVALDIIKKYQTQNAHKSKLSTQYWLNLGFDKSIAKMKASEYASKHSAWCIEYWMNKGYTREESIFKTMESHIASPLYKKYNNSIEKFIQAQELYHKKALETQLSNKEQYKTKMLQLGYRSISKEEQQCFETLLLIHPEILHIPYVVMFPENFASQYNKTCYICDGYIQYKDAVIIIEYDGSTYHCSDKDKIRDEEILHIAPEVLGIIRIKDSFILSNNKYINGISEPFNNALNEIMQGRTDIVILS